MIKMMITPTDITAVQCSFSFEVTTPDVDTVTLEPKAISVLENICSSRGCLTNED